MTETTATPRADINATIHTSLGDIRIRLYGDTPGHLENFVKLAREGFYNGVLFHRTIADFMVQTGDPESVGAPKGKRLGEGGPGYDIDAEIDFPRHYHKRGAIAAARLGDAMNPQKRSSGSQFYIVTGKQFTNGQLDTMERNMRLSAIKDEFSRLAAANRDAIMTMRRNRDTAGLQELQERLAAEAEATVNERGVLLTPEMRRAYTTEGGTPHLDGGYSVFGEVTEGMDIVDRIQKAETDSADRPLTDIVITGITIDND